MISLNTTFYKILGRKFCSLDEVILQVLDIVTRQSFIMSQCMFLGAMTESIRTTCLNLLLKLMNGLILHKMMFNPGQRHVIEHMQLFTKTQCIYLEDMMDQNS